MCLEEGWRIGAMRYRAIEGCTKSTFYICIEASDSPTFISSNRIEQREGSEITCGDEKWVKAQPGKPDSLDLSSQVGKLGSPILTRE